MAIASPPSTPIRHHRFTVEQYHRMIETRVFTEADRVELLNGEIVDMSPIGKEHSSVVNQLANFFYSLAHGSAIVSVQNPILITTNRSEPEPDLALLKFRTDFYRKNLPEPKDIMLLIEVADTSLEADRTIKIPLYASAGMNEVWLVDLNAKCIEVFQKPVDGQYSSVRTFKGVDKVAPASFPNHFIALNELFPD